MASSEPIDPLIQKATDWLQRLEALPHDATLRGAAETWRTESPEHARAWARAERTWRLLEQIPFSNEGPSRGRATVAHHWLQTHRAMAASFIVALALMVMIPMWSGPHADFATETAEVRRVTLEDGSLVDLGPQSALDVAYSADRRAVTLLAGEAFFTVMPNADRPFEVKSGDLTVTVVGTSFDVRVSADQLSVGVTDGTVEARYTRALDRPVRLTAGDQLSITRSTGTVRQSSVPPAELGAWRSHQLSVENMPLREVVAEIRRYSSAWIVFDDRRFADQQVTGFYDLRDPDRALRLIVRPFGGRVREVTPFVRVISGP